VIDGLLPYAKYKDSGLPWLPKIPASWSVARNGRMFTHCNRTGHSDLPILEVSLRSGVRVRDMKDGGRKQVMSDRSKYKQARAGDLAYNTMRMWQGAVGVAPVDGLVSPAYVVAKPDEEVVADYLARLFRTKEYLREIDTFSRGIVKDRNRLYWEAFKQIPSPMPPKAEQLAIVRFLAEADLRVRRALSAKRVLIARLEEQKQFIIHRAITRGLDPSVRLRPSGIPWLGDVPAHWNLRKLKRLTSFHNGLPFKPADWKSSGTPIIRIQNLNGSDDFNYTTRTDLSTFLLIQRGDLLFSWSGNRGTSFGPFVWNRDFAGYLNQHIFKLAGFTLDRTYFAHLLRAVTRHIEEQTHGIIGLVHITKPELGSVVVPVAPGPEQVAIARWIDERVSELDVLVDRARRAIALLHAFNERLTASVVSGALDVRGAAALLPEPTGESEPSEIADGLAGGDGDPESAEAEAIPEGAEA
jgi:type I restriction enzyme S subunit